VNGVLHELIAYHLNHQLRLLCWQQQPQSCPDVNHSGEAAVRLPERAGTGCYIGWHEAAQICSHAVSLQDKMLGIVHKERGYDLAGMKLLM
jgi:hypothetical protein